MWTDFNVWLAQQGYPQNTSASTVARVQRLSEAYGDLAVLYQKDRLEGLCADLAYGMADERRGRRNPSKVQIGGDLRNGLASLKTAARLYSQHLDEKAGLIANSSPKLQQAPRAAPVTAEATPLRHLSGGELLAEATATMGISLAELVARCSIWAHPEIVGELVRQDRNAAWFPRMRRMKSGETRGSTVDGVRLDDNSYANQAIKLATFGQRGVKDFHACHVWSASCYDARHHTSICNLVLVPAPLAGLTDHDETVAASLRRRAFELFGWHPEGSAVPEQPAGYPADSAWRAIPSPSAAVRRALATRRRLLSA